MCFRIWFASLLFHTIVVMWSLLISCSCSQERNRMAVPPPPLALIVVVFAFVMGVRLQLDYWLGRCLGGAHSHIGHVAGDQSLDNLRGRGTWESSRSPGRGRIHSQINLRLRALSVHMSRFHQSHCWSSDDENRHDGGALHDGEEKRTCYDSM